MSQVIERQKSIPAYWLSSEQFEIAADSLDKDDADSFFSLRGYPILPPSDDIHIAVIGETLTLLRGHDVILGRSLELRSHFLGVQMLTCKEAERAHTEIDHFLASVNDEVLSDAEYEFLTLYQGDPNRIRRSLVYLSQVLSVPSPYAGVMILNR